MKVIPSPTRALVIASNNANKRINRFCAYQAISDTPRSACHASTTDTRCHVCTKCLTSSVKVVNCRYKPNPKQPASYTKHKSYPSRPNRLTGLAMAAGVFAISPKLIAFPRPSSEIATVMKSLWTSNPINLIFEPLAKLMSGDRLPHFGPFPSLNFALWNHRAAHSIPKMVSKWECRSSTRSFARGSFPSW